MVGSPRSPRLYQLLSKGRLYHFKKGEAVFSTTDSDHVMIVVKGYVKRYMISNNGSLGVQIIYGPQAVFSLTHVYSMLLSQSLYDGPETYYYKAMSEVQLFSLDGATFSQAVQQDPLLYKELFSEAGHHLKTCVHNIENISLLNAYARVAHELLFMSRHFGLGKPGGKRLALPLTHQDLADMLGITRETVTKAVMKLRENGVLSEERRFTILDMGRLETAAYQ